MQSVSEMCRNEVDARTLGPGGVDPIVPPTSNDRPITSEISWATTPKKS
jgi:hypothetical protein